MMPLNYKSARKLLEANGWSETRGGKYAIKMEKGERPSPCLSTAGAITSKGLEAAIKKQAGLG